MFFNPKLPDIVDFLLRRRSVKSKTMYAPGPDDREMRQILEAGMRVPDHGKLAPWSFRVLDETAQQDLADVIATAYRAEEGRETLPGKLASFATSAPTMVIVVSHCKDEKPIPEIEQRFSAGAACQTMLIAATGLGFGAQWLTGWAAYSPGVQAALGLKPRDMIAGFLFFGSYEDEPSERPRPDFDAVVSFGLMD